MFYEGKFHNFENNLKRSYGSVIPVIELLDVINESVQLTCGSTNSSGIPNTTSLLRSRLNTVHLDKYGSFGGEEKFQKDSTWIIRQALSPVHDSLAISLESTSKPGYFLHCTRTGRARIESAKHQNNKFLKELSWMVCEKNNGSVQLNSLAQPNYCLIVNSHGQARLRKISEEHEIIGENSGNWWFSKLE